MGDSLIKTRVRARAIGFKGPFILFSILIGLWLWITPEFLDLSGVGKRCFVLTLAAIVLWSSGLIAHAYTTFLLFAGFIFSGVASSDELFSFFLSPLIWMLVGSFLIAQAISKSGLATRISYNLIDKLIHSYKSFIVYIYLLNLLLSLLIPQPFPRVILLMSIVKQILENSDLDHSMKRVIGFSVFCSATVTSSVLFTGDVLLNGAVFTLTGSEISWWIWLKTMAIPGLVASITFVVTHFLLFKEKVKVQFNMTKVKEELADLGPLSAMEWKVLGWTLIAIAFWATEPLHHISPAWISLVCAAGLSLPIIGDVLKEEDISSKVNWNIIFFVIGSLSIGKIGMKTGMSEWMIHLLVPKNLGGSFILSLIVIVFISVVLHMFIGSAFATMSLIVPPLISIFPSIHPLLIGLIVYTTVAFHFFLPFHNVVMVIGAGTVGYFNAKETLRFGIPLTVILLFIALVVEPLWWHVIHLI